MRITLHYIGILLLMIVAGLQQDKLWCVAASEIVDNFLKLPLVTVTLHHNDPLKDAFFSHDDRKLVTLSCKNNITIWDVLTGNPLITIAENSWVKSLLFSKDGSKLVIVCNKKLKICDALTGLVLHTFNHADQINSIELNDDGIRLLTASSDNTAKIWDIVSGNLLGKLEYNAPLINALFNSNGMLTVTLLEDKTAKIWHSTIGNLVHTLDNNNYIISVVFNNDTTQIATVSHDDTNLRMWDCVSGKPLHILNHPTWVTGALYSNSSKKIITTSYKAPARIWDLEQEGRYKEIGHSNWIKRTILDNDDILMVTTSYNDYTTAGIWHFLTGKILYNVRHNDEISSTAFNNAGTHLLTAALDKKAKIYNLGPINVAAHFKKIAPLKDQALLVILNEHSKKRNFKGIDALLKKSRTSDLKQVFNALPKNVQQGLRHVYT